MSYKCPLCSQLLKEKLNGFCCANNHQFDIAKEGYVNLIPANKKRSKNPGDNGEMMQARRRFLNNHYYAPLRDRVAQLAQESVLHQAERALDIGCGEGYYTSKLAKLLKQNNANIDVYGLDISKVAIRYAAKRYPNCRFSVASSQHLPFTDSSLDLIIRIYAPCNPEEMRRTLKPQGSIITVTPGARHLYQLRDRIYDGVRLHDEKEEAIAGFELKHQEKLLYNMELRKGDALDLLQMTPFAWKASPELKIELSAEESFTCEADFVIRHYIATPS